MAHTRALQEAQRSEADTMFRKLRNIAAPGMSRRPRASWEDGRERRRRPVMKSGAPDYDAWYSRTPSQAEGERDETGERTATERHPDVPRSEPSQAEGERGDDA
ncbi:predicted protein [Streptomyces viridochromogenes DSM 40736]|uniref:Predicted protein n=4 Tax=Streptomyces TaxID=1883 RepID=D9X8V8_STRVT|nr:predicted protein [Streptomyces viridochromogenes DSM 40736]